MNPPEIKVTLDPPGEGVHSWIMRAAWELRAADVTAPSAIEQIKATEPKLRQGRTFQANEVEAAVAKVYECDLSKLPKREPRWKPRKHEVRQEEVSPLDGMQELRDASPWDSPHLITAEMAVDLLFPEDDLICMARWKPWKMPGEKRTLQAVTRRREGFRGMEHSLPFIVPSRAIKEKGKNHNGRTSRRCLEMFPRRDFAVVEFDDGESREVQCGRIIKLSRMAKLTMVCESGGKSIHAWFLVEKGDREKDVEDFYRGAISMGGDPAGRNRCQLFRTPGAWRHMPGSTWETDTTLECYTSGIRQRVQYFDPTATIMPSHPANNPTPLGMDEITKAATEVFR